MDNNRIMLLWTVLAMLFLVSFVSLGYSIKFNEKDYIITDFGINKSNPFITVQGIAGGSYDPSLGDEGYQAYVFDTDKGVYQITASEGSSNKPYYGTDHILSKEIKLHECLITEVTHGKPHFYNNTVEYVDHNQNFSKVMRVYSIQVSVDDPDERCQNGEHIQKIRPNQINATMSNASLITGPVVINKNRNLVKETPGSVNIDTSNGEYHCNGSPRMGKISGLFVDAYNRHGTVSGQWTLANEKGNGQDTSGNITGASISVSSYNLTGKTNKDAICPTIYDKITISGGCVEGKLVEMKTSGGRAITSLKGNARCLPG